MTTIYVSNKASEQQYNSIVEIIERELIHNCNLAGADIVIERDTYTWIDGIDEYDYTLIQLINKLLRIIESN
jgi:hypothetical protein